jgi:hypothetical protein
LAYNFNNDLSNQSPEAPAAQSPNPVPSPVSPTPIPLTPVTSDNPESAAGVRFRSCRWMQKEESGNQPFCTHREVKPYAGMQGFDAEAWCPECQYYKLRRAPRKRTDETYSY